MRQGNVIDIFEYSPRAHAPPTEPATIILGIIYMSPLGHFEASLVDCRLRRRAGFDFGLGR